MNFYTCTRYLICNCFFTHIWFWITVKQTCGPKQTGDAERIAETESKMEEKGRKHTEGT